MECLIHHRHDQHALTITSRSRTHTVQKIPRNRKSRNTPTVHSHYSLQHALGPANQRSPTLKLSNALTFTANTINSAMRYSTERWSRQRRAHCISTIISLQRLATSPPHAPARPQALCTGLGRVPTAGRNWYPAACNYRDAGFHSP